MAVPTPIASGGKVKFFARKRPLFDNELQRGEYDVVTTVHGWTIVHMCGMAPDLLRMHIAHSHFPCSEAFGENSTNNELHDEAMSPLVKHAQSGGMATCLMYGATGSGKTYTMTAMQERAAANICSAGAVAVTMLELAGKDVRDLLAPSGARAVTLRENAVGELDLGGASVHLSTTSADLLELLAIGQQRRTTCGTLMNAVSSRSHMVCFLRLNDGGCLALVDCAGSERKEDSSRHTAERQREGADINSSLLALKECIRALTSGAKHVPYRMSSLTRVLRGSFTTPGAMLHVIATVAPGCSDAEHSVATLRMATGLCECSDQVFECKEDVQPVRKSGISEVLHSVPTAVRSRASAPSGGRRNFYSSGASGEQLPVDKARGGGADDVARSRGSAPRSVTPTRRSAYVDVAIRGEVPCQASSASSTANKARGSGAADAARVRDNARRSVTPTRRSARVDAPIHGEGPCQAASASSAVWPKTEPSRASCGPSRAAASSGSSAPGSSKCTSTMASKVQRVRSISPMRGGDVDGASIGATSITLSHPNTWSFEELKSWLQRQKLTAKLPGIIDGRTAMRWNVKRWTEVCGGDERAGLRAFNGLRLESDRLADEEKRRRKQIMHGR